VLGARWRSAVPSTSLHRVVVNVTRVIVHASYDVPVRHSNDVAVLVRALVVRMSCQVLAEPVVYGVAVTPVCLAQREPSAGTQCVTTGWGEPTRESSGYRNPGDTVASENSRLQQVMVPIVNSSICNDAAHYDGRIDEERMLCAGEGSRDSCQVPPLEYAVGRQRRPARVRVGRGRVVVARHRLVGRRLRTCEPTGRLRAHDGRPPLAPQAHG